MKKIRVLTIIPICLMLMLTPVSGIRAGAVTVDIKDNYDAGLLGEERDGNGKDEDEDAASTASSSTAANSASKASSAASNTASSTAPAATTPTTTTPAATDVAANTASTAATTTTTDLPKTGDDNRIMITFIAMLASFSVFLTALLTGKHLKA
ncbi:MULTISPECIES: hypothetical protein [unclassified Butyrivibrio]|uniref:hypothetical protein n=1 Tax=unclassified Butyrivibrio TaxID=2639466 RepID=UPI0003B65E43|nr:MULTISPECIES: hypothetical protein [unclassified Butyrivibrio]